MCTVSASGGNTLTISAPGKWPHEAGVTGMDIAGMWRDMHPDTGEMPRPGMHQEAPAGGITITVMQQCQVALPVPSLKADEVTVTVTSHRPGVAAQVTVGANLNSADGNYQGPTTTVGQGQFTVTDSQVHVGFVVLPTDPWPVLGVGAEAIWADGTAQSIDLTYLQIECEHLVWLSWLIRLITILTRPFSARR